MVDQPPYGGGTWFDHRQGLRCCNAPADMYSLLPSAGPYTCKPYRHRGRHRSRRHRHSPAGEEASPLPAGRGAVPLPQQQQAQPLFPSYVPSTQQPAAPAQVNTCTSQSLACTWQICSAMPPTICNSPCPLNRAHTCLNTACGHLPVEYRAWDLASSVPCAGEVWMACSSTCSRTCGPSAQADAATGCYFTWWACGHGS